MIAIVLPFVVPAAIILATAGVRRVVVRRRRLAAAHDRLGRLALPPPGSTPYQQALSGYLDALDRCVELREERRRRRAPPPPTSLPSRGVPRSG